jgi:hypothetical protein
MTVLGDSQWDQSLLDQSARSFAQLMAPKYPHVAVYDKPSVSTYWETGAVLEYTELEGLRINERW